MPILKGYEDMGLPDLRRITCMLVFLATLVISMLLLIKAMQTLPIGTS